MAFTLRGERQLTLEQLANRVVWVKALLSGKYEQGRKRLRTSENTWCCLGVAAHCIDSTLGVVAEGSMRALLDSDWAEKNLGIHDDEENDQSIAARWNDSEEYSFLQIADRIALATDKNQSLNGVFHPPELMDEEPGDYAREWLSQQV